MAIFSVFDSFGSPVAFYDDTICHNIPSGAIELTKDQWIDLISNQGLRKWDGQNIIEYSPKQDTESLASYNSTKRWEVETGGIILNGINIATDDRSKVMISGARVAAQSNPDFTTEWKTESGFVTLDASDVIDISDAVLQHVSDCFAKEATIQTMIDNGDVATVEQIDTLWQE